MAAGFSVNGVCYGSREAAFGAWSGFINTPRSAEPGQIMACWTNGLDSGSQGVPWVTVNCGKTVSGGVPPAFQWTATASEVPFIPGACEFEQLARFTAGDAAQLYVFGFGAIAVVYGLALFGRHLKKALRL